MLDNFASAHPLVPDQCCHLLKVWFEEDVDSNLDNLGYILEGLGMIAASDATKRFLEPADKMEDISE